MYNKQNIFKYKNMSINWEKESVNENSEPRKKQGDIESLASKVYNSYVEKWISENGVWFVNRIMSLPDTDTSYQDEVMSFINGKKEFDELGEDFKSKMSLWKIKARLTPEYALYKTRRLGMKKLIQKYFDVSEEGYSRDIESKIVSLSHDQLKEYSRSSEKIRIFFREAWITEPQKRNIKWFLEWLDIDWKLASLPLEKRNEIKWEITDTIQGTSLSSPNFARKINDLIHRLLREGVFDSMQKKELILAFLPTIKLSEIKAYGLMTETEIENYIKTELIADIDNTHKAEALRQITARLGDIEIPTSKLKLSKTEVLDTILRNGDFERFARELQDFHHLWGENTIWDFETLSDLIKTELAEKVSWVENFSAGNILVLHGKKWTQDEIQYHEIVSTRSENPPHEKLTFYNRGGNGIYSSSEVRPEYQTYKDFYELLKNPKFVSRVEFVPKTQFDEKVESGEVSQVEGEYHFEVLNTSWNYNTERLRQAIDILDTNGKKYWFEKWVTFRTEWTLQNGGDDLYTIVSIDEQKLPWGEIMLSNIWGKQEKLNFEQFFETWKQKKTNRAAKVNSWEELVSDVGGEASLWTQVKFRDGVLMNEEYKDKSKQKVEFLVSENSISFWGDTNLIQIHSISWNTAEISFWKYKDKVLPDSRKNILWKPANYSVSKDKLSVSLGMLAVWSKEAKLEWRNLKGENIQEKLPDEAKLKDEVLSNYLNNFANISSLLAAWKMWTENMKNYFEDETNEQAMKLASKLPVFSDEQRSSMKMRLEQSEKKSTDDALEKLKVLDSAPATELVAKWLTNKHTTESRKVAALLYMLEKYGVLYEKKAMMKHKGTFLFYTAFWWTVWDELYNLHKEECRNAGKQFLEEDLIYKLISQKCKDWKLRGRLYKEVENIMWKWLTDEMEKWKSDAEKKGTYQEKEDFAFGELQDGWYPNAMWAYEEMVGKWNTPQRLNKLPFVMLMSGAASSFSAQLTNKFKLWNLVLTTFFTHNSHHTALFQRVVWHLCNDIKNHPSLWNTYGDILKDFEKNITSQKWNTQAERIKASKEFYEKYEDVLGWALLMLNTQKSGPETEFETWIRDKSDTNPDYKEYAWLIDIGFDAWKDKFFWEQEALLRDAFYLATKENGWMTWINTQKFVEKFMQPQSWGVWFRNNEMWKLVWKEITNKIDYIVESDTDEVYKRTRIWDIIAEMMDGLSGTYAQNPFELEKILTNQASVFYSRFNQWGVQASDFALGWDSFKTCKKWKLSIEKYVDNILRWKLTSQDVNIFSMQDLIKSKVQSWVASNLNQNPYNRSYDEAA